MKPRMIAAVMLLFLCFTSVASADEMYGEFYANGTSLIESEARAEAHEAIEAFVADWEDELEPGQEILVVIGDHYWDMPDYTIVFWVVILDEGA